MDPEGGLVGTVRGLVFPLPGAGDGRASQGSSASLYAERTADVADCTVTNTVIAQPGPEEGGGLVERLPVAGIEPGAHHQHEYHTSPETPSSLAVTIPKSTVTIPKPTVTIPTRNPQSFPGVPSIPQQAAASGAKAWQGMAKSRRKPRGILASMFGCYRPQALD